MAFPPLTVVDIQEEIRGIDTYKNIPVALANDHVVRLSVMTAAYHWHYHPNSDEIFLVLEGVLCIELEAKTVELQVGQLFTIPANVRHRTWPKGSRSVNLTIERTDLETVSLDL